MVEEPTRLTERPPESPEDPPESLPPMASAGAGANARPRLSVAAIAVAANPFIVATLIVRSPPWTGSQAVALAPLSRTLLPYYA